MAISIEHKNLLKILTKEKSKRVVGGLCWGDTLGYYFNLKAKVNFRFNNIHINYILLLLVLNIGPIYMVKILCNVKKRCKG
jgi:hypothetical protein